MNAKTMRDFTVFKRKHRKMGRKIEKRIRSIVIVSVRLVVKNNEILLI